MKRKQIVVIGLGRMGLSLAATLYSLGHEVMAIDSDEKNVQAVASQITHAVQADATSETALRELGIGNFDIAIVAIGTTIEDSVLVTLLLKKLGVRNVIARAENELHGTILEKVGADKVIYPERDTGIMLAHVLMLGDAIDFIPVLPGYGVLKIVAPDYFFGEKLENLGFGVRGKREVSILLLQRGKEVIIAPSTEELVRPGDALVISGTSDRIEELLDEARKHRAEKEKR